MTVTSLPVSSRTLSPSASAYFLPELEDVAHLDAARGLQLVAAARALVAGAHLGGLDGAVGGEVTSRDEVDDVAAGLVGAGDPPGAVDDAGVDEEAHAGRLVGAEHPGTDVPLDQLRAGARSPSKTVATAAVELGAQALLVDLAVTRDADREDLAACRRVRSP